MKTTFVQSDGSMKQTQPRELAFLVVRPRWRSLGVGLGATLERVYKAVDLISELPLSNCSNFLVMQKL
jgi:hypothetical protein